MALPPLCEFRNATFCGKLVNITRRLDGGHHICLLIHQSAADQLFDNGLTEGLSPTIGTHNDHAIICYLGDGLVKPSLDNFNEFVEVTVVYISPMTEYCKAVHVKRLASLGDPDDETPSTMANMLDPIGMECELGEDGIPLSHPILCHSKVYDGVNDLPSPDEADDDDDEYWPSPSLRSGPLRINPRGKRIRAADLRSNPMIDQS